MTLTRIVSCRLAEMIGEAYELIDKIMPGAMPLALQTDWFEGDPLFAGLHHFGSTADGRSYHNTCHTLYPWHLSGPASRRRTTVVMVGNFELSTVVHELGHVVHAALDFDPAPVPVTAYAHTNRNEAFAEAWTTEMFYDYGDEKAASTDHESRRLWESFA